MNASVSISPAVTPAQRLARRMLGLYGGSFALFGAVFLLLGALHLAGAVLPLPFDSYTWYAISFIGCLMIGLALLIGNALSGAGERAYLRTAAITLGLFVAMRVGFLVLDATLRGVAAPLLIGESLLFGGVALAFLVIRGRL